MSVARHNLGVIAASDGFIYAIGGFTETVGDQHGKAVERYNPSANTWETLDDIPSVRLIFAIAEAHGSLYVIGGSGSGVLNTVEKFDLADQSWATGSDVPANAPTTRIGAGAVTVNGKIYVMGGSFNSPRSPEVDIYDPGMNTWTSGSDMPTPRHSAGVVTDCDDNIYAIGGSGNASSGAPPATNIVEKYNPSSNTWQSDLAPMPTVREAVAVVLGNDCKIYVIGGIDQTNGVPSAIVFDIVEQYDPYADAWATCESMPTARAALGAARDVNGIIYAIGGLRSATSADAFDVREAFEPCEADAEGPTTSAVLVDPNPVEVNNTVTLSANVDDSNTGGSNIASAEYSLDGGNTWGNPMSADADGFNSVNEDVTATIGPFNHPQVLKICVRGTDSAVNTGEEACIFLAAYDPSGGFVTGGGWIDSPSGAYTPEDPNDEDFMGKANFGFVSKYKKGASVPTGNTEFNFKAGDLNFHSNAYDWLVVNQGGTNAQYKGSGTIHGALAPSGEA